MLSLKSGLSIKRHHHRLLAASSPGFFKPTPAALFAHLRSLLGRCSARLTSTRPLHPTCESAAVDSNHHHLSRPPASDFDCSPAHRCSWEEAAGVDFAIPLGISTQHVICLHPVPRVAVRHHENWWLG
nr:hypothetical protein CFP56_59631 [Quercus suber]